MSQDPGVPAGTTYSPDYLNVTETVPVDTGATTVGTSTSEPSTSDVAKDQAASVGQSAAGAGQHVAGVAKDEAANVGQTAADAGQHVAGVAKEQAATVATEAKVQAKDVLDQARTEGREQAATQQARVASGLRSIGEELESMVRGSQQSGVVTDLAQQAAGRVHDVAGWLDTREPGDLLTDLKDYARRRPGTFLAVAAGAGLLAGRLTRGLTGGSDDDAGPGPVPTSGTPATAAYAPGSYAPAADVYGEVPPAAGTYPTPAATTDPTTPTVVVPEGLYGETVDDLGNPLQDDLYVAPERYEGVERR